MEITRVSNEGSVIIPETLLRATGWEIGQELIAIDMGEGILLKPKKPFSETTLDDVEGCLKYQGTPKTLEDMDDAISLLRSFDANQRTWVQNCFVTFLLEYAAFLIFRQYCSFSRS